jgi:two-component system phosphate regulon sensor histidine kinase PhoR
VLQINPALERMCSLTSIDWRGRPYAEVIRHEDLGELVSRVLTTRNGEDHQIVLFPGGRCLRVVASLAGGQRDNEACVVLVFHDITELRRLENIRKDFVANVSHELRTPLTSIQGYVEALIDGGIDDTETAARFLDIILRQSNRLNLILNDLLQLSQIESGQMPLRMDPLDLKSVLERTVAFIKPLADKKQHAVTVTLPERIPLVTGDEERLVQVFTNLLDNAVKYTPDRGTIALELRHAPQEGRTSDALDIHVSDSGIGIPEPDRPRVFERFYRVDKARSRELGGTGLGLAIVKHIVEGHGGLVWMEGNHPHGSRFIVRLPVNHPG